MSASPTLEEVKKKFFENVQNAIWGALKRALSAQLQVETEIGSWLLPLLGAWLDKDWVVVGVFEDGVCSIHVNRRVPLQA